MPSLNLSDTKAFSEFHKAILDGIKSYVHTKNGILNKIFGINTTKLFSAQNIRQKISTARSFEELKPILQAFFKMNEIKNSDSALNIVVLESLLGTLSSDDRVDLKAQLVKGEFNNLEANFIRLQAVKELRQGAGLKPGDIAIKYSEPAKESIVEKPSSISAFY